MSVAAELYWFRQLRKFREVPTQGVRDAAVLAIQKHIEEQKRAKSQATNHISNP